MNLGKYELNNVYVIDAVLGMKDLPDECIDLTVTSPPYDNLRKYKTKKKFDFESVAKELYRITKQGGVVVWVVGDQTIHGSETGTSFKQALFFKDVVGFRLHDTMIYSKSNYIPLTHRRYEQQFEYMFVFSKGSPKTFNPIMVPSAHSGKLRVSKFRRKAGKNSGTDELEQSGGFGTPISDNKIKSNIWTYVIGCFASATDKSAFEHPAVFPEKMVADHIISWSEKGDLIFDPMVGSGTTTVVARALERNFIGFDESEDYIRIARRRKLPKFEK